MVIYASVILKFISLGLVIAAAGFWAGTEVYGRPKYRDEQTLIGGAVWAQTVIPIGLIVSNFIDEQLNVFVHAYFLVAGAVLLVTTGLVLIIGESTSMRARRTSIPTLSNIHDTGPTFDRMYFTIGILTLLAAIFTIADFIVIII